jgi:hypothetical protein
MPAVSNDLPPKLTGAPMFSGPCEPYRRQGAPAGAAGGVDVGRRGSTVGKVAVDGPDSHSHGVIAAGVTRA